jgi:hypothetical protein
MKLEEIDRALRSDPGMQPSAEFASRVMGAVRREVQDQGSIAFPWRRLLPGLIVCCLLTVAALIFAEPRPVPEPIATTLRDPRFVQAATWVPLYVLGTWVMIRAVLRFAGFGR